MTQTTAFCVDDEAREYLSTLITLELCKELHKHDKPNTAIRKCCAYLIERTQGARCKAILAGLMAQPMPAGSLHQLRRVLNEMAGGEVVWGK